jgi:glycine cleavage system aminomethyltransferase T
MDQAIAMGYVTKEFSAVDTEVRIIIRNKALSAKVTRFPFLKLK